MKLREYQQRSITAIYDYFRSGKRGSPIVVLPTGAGKSVVLAELIRSAFAIDPNQRIIVATHQKELIEQDFEKMMSLWPQAPAGIFSASVGRRDAAARILFVGVQTVYNKTHQLGWCDLLIIDECHLLPESGEGRYRTFIDGLRRYNPHMPVVGLTATPYRNGQGLLTEGKGAIFTDIILDLSQGIELIKLIDDGFLSPLRPKAMRSSIDVSKVKVTAGEFNLKALEEVSNTDEINKGAVDEIVANGMDRKSWLVFCAGVAHAVAVRDEIRSRGIACEVVHGETPKPERERILADFKAGRLRAVTNANVLTTGFDHPGLDLIALLRATQSASLHVQMLGRGMRVASGKVDCLVLDFAGNTRRLGPINAIRIPKRRGAGGGGEPPGKECPKCHEIVATATRECPGCGHQFPPPDPVSKLSTRAGGDKLILRPEDALAWHRVYDVRYSIHQPPGKRPSLKVTYDCEIRMFHEWVPLEDPYGRHARAARWWKERLGDEVPLPDTAMEAVSYGPMIPKPKFIHVSEFGRFPEIVGHDFIGNKATNAIAA